MERKHIMGLIGLGLLVLGGAGAALWFAGPEQIASETTALSSDISSATESPGAKRSKPVAPKVPTGPYEPTSEYIEPGLDPGVTNLAMGSGERQPDPNLPEMLSGRAIQQVMNAHQQELIGCYADSLKTDPDLAGRVFFNFGVAPDGHVAMVRVTDSKLRSKETEDCFVDKARHWTFPATRREVLTRFDTDFNFVTQ